MADIAPSPVVEWLASRREAMLSLLGELVAIDSGTANHRGVAQVAARLAAFFAEAGIETEPVVVEGSGAGLRVTIPGAKSARPILLMGHLDTVFPEGEAARRPFSIVGDRAYGPGVADMKGGLVLLAFVLAALQAVGGDLPPLVGFFTADEEIGSPAYRPLIEAEARHADFAFNAEPGRASGNVVTSRRGGVFMRVTIEGKAAHAGVDSRAGISAIDELAHKIVALHALTDLERGINLNVGVVDGGQSVNTTAASATALVDLRFREPEDRDRMMKAVEDIVAKSWTAGTRSRLEVTGGFLPIVPTAASTALFDLYRSSAEAIGFSVGGEATGGCADSGFAAAMGAAALCGVGPVGGGAHSPAEYVEIDSLVPRAQALALTIQRLAEAVDDQNSHPRAQDAGDPSPRRQSAAPQRETS